jgi:hypothetical protein
MNAPRSTLSDAVHHKKGKEGHRDRLQDGHPTRPCFRRYRSISRMPLFSRCCQRWKKGRVTEKSVRVRTPTHDAVAALIILRLQKT